LAIGVVGRFGSEGGGFEVDGEAISCVDLGEFVFDSGEADLESLDFAEPAMKFGLVDAVL